MYGDDPPDALTLAVPSLPPLQVASVPEADAEGAPASLTVTAEDAIQPSASVSVTE